MDLGLSQEKIVNFRQISSNGTNLIVSLFMHNTLIPFRNITSNFKAYTVTQLLGVNLHNQCRDWPTDWTGPEVVRFDDGVVCPNEKGRISVITSSHPLSLSLEI